MNDIKKIKQHTMEYNMNCKATITPTVIGKKILENHFKKVPALAKLDDNGDYSASMWQMFQIFGSALYNGCDIPFDRNSITINGDQQQ